MPLGNGGLGFGAAGFASRVWEVLDSGGFMVFQVRDRHKIWGLRFRV